MPGLRQDLRRRLMALAFDQAGYFTAAQARDLGYSYQAQKYHTDYGNWVRVDRGIYRFPAWPATSADAYIRWALWSGGRGVVSHESALAVHELSDANPSSIHLTVGIAFGARDDAVVLHVAELTDDDIESRGTWAVTTPRRTLVDVAGSDIAQEHVNRAVADVVERGLLTRRQLFRLADEVDDRPALRLERALGQVEAGR